MNRSLWLLGALLFAAGVVLQIEVRRRSGDGVTGAESTGRAAPPAAPGPSLSRESPGEARGPDRAPVEEPALPPGELPVERAAGPSVEEPDSGRGPRELAVERAAEPSGTALARRLRELAEAERLPADWAGVLEELPRPAAPEVVSGLREVVRGHRDLEVAQQVLRTLERLGGTDAVRALYEIGIERGELLSEAAVRLSRVRGRASAPALLEITRDPAAPDELAAAALRSLGHTALRDPVDEIRSIAADGARSVSVRIAAAEALGWIADPDGLPGLIPLLESRERGLRRQAIRSLGRIRDPRSIAALRELIRTGSNEQERLMAEDALARLEGRPGRR